MYKQYDKDMINNGIIPSPTGVSYSQAGSAGSYPGFSPYSTINLGYGL